MNQLKLISILILIFHIQYIVAQPWVEKGIDADGNLNFFLMQEEAEKYFQLINTEEKGKGFKAYKRWEHYWKDRVDENGYFPEAGINERNFNEYLKNNNGRDRNSTANWTSLGPTTTPGGYAGIGRINCVAFHPTNVNIIWAGSPGGGLWKSTDGGSTWTTNFDNSVVLGVSSILIHPTNPNIMYIATGDGDGADTYSTGVLKSTNGGDTWQTTGLNWTVTQTRLIRRIIFDPDDPNTILAATSNGIYRTTNAGTNWSQIITGNFFDVRANPDAASNTFYATTGSVLHKSTNNGSSFTNVQTITGSNRISLGVSPQNSNIVYALCSNSSGSGFLGFYKSTDAGSTYTIQASSPNLLGWSSTGSDSGGQGWYDLCVAVDPTNADIIYTGGVNIWKSTNGGVSWSLRTHWSGAPGVQTVHADHHCLEWQNNNSLWLGNDGGVYVTTNGGVNWTNRSNGLIISQMYRLDVSQIDTKVITGLQDNGTKLRQTSGSWSDVIGGDGMDCAIQPNSASIVYGSYQYGNWRRSTNGGSSFSTMNVPDIGSGAWITPIAIDPSNPQTIYIAFNRVHKSTNQGASWTTISENLNNNDLTYIQVAPNNPNFIYTGRSNALYRTTDGGTSWTTMTVPTGTGYNDLAISPTDPNTIWIVRTGYNSGSKVFKSINGGSTWTNISGSLPNLAANCIIYQNGTNDGLYVGMDVGIYYRDNTMSDWELYNNGIPNVEIFDLKIKYNTAEIMAATYGRGLWKSPLRQISGCLSVQNITVENIEINTASMRWTPANPPGIGYQYAVSLSPTPPSSGTQTSDTTAVFTNLLSNSAYYFYVRSQCEDGTFSPWSSSGPHQTKTTCGNTSTDTGGSGNNYGDNETTIRYICPGGPYQQAVLTFTDFDVEPAWDALYVYNGNSTNSPLFASNNPATQAGFPAGGWYGTSLPGPFTSTHPTGCLTLLFRSDESVTGRGWTGNVSCIDNCTMVVRVTNDDGPNSLRYAINCAAPGSSITFAPTVHNSTITLLSPVVITKNLTISMTNENTKIQSGHAGYLFEVMPGVTFTLNNVQLTGGNGGNATRVLFNRGNIIMTDVDILDVLANSGNGKTIDNQGTATINGLYRIRTN